MRMEVSLGLRDRTKVNEQDQLDKDAIEKYDYAVKLIQLID
jgi:hypothetical protein